MRLFQDLRLWWHRRLFRWGPRSFYLLWEAVANPNGHPLLKQHSCYHYPWAALDLPEGVSVLAWVDRQWCTPWMVIYWRHSEATLRDWLESMPDYDTFAATCQLVGCHEPVLTLLNMPLPHDQESHFGPAHFLPVLVDDDMPYIQPYDHVPADRVPEPIIDLIARLRDWKHQRLNVEAAELIRDYWRRPEVRSTWIEPDGWLCYVDQRGTIRRLPKHIWENRLVTADGQFVAAGAWISGTDLCWIDRHTGKMQRHQGEPTPR